MKSVGNITVFQIGQGNERRWRASLTVGHGPKGPKRVSRHGKTRQEAQDKIYRLKADLERNQLQAGRTPTYHDYTMHWLFELKKGSVTDGTLANYHFLYMKYIAPTLGGLKMDQITANGIQSLMRQLHEKGLSKSTVNSVKGQIRRVFNAAIREGVVFTNPGDFVSSMRRTKEDFTRVQKPLSLSEADVLLRVSYNTDFDLFVHLILILGLRRGEALGLRRQDIDIDNGVIEINGAISEQAEVSTDGSRRIRKVRTAPKTASGYRRLAVSTPITAALMRQREKAKEFASLNGTEPEYLIFDATGGPFNPSNYAKRFNRWIASVGLRRIRIHDYRHTCATIAINEGIDPVTVQVGLGHSRLETTKNIYAKAADARGIAFGRVMGGMFVNENDAFGLDLFSKDMEIGVTNKPGP